MALTEPTLTDLARIGQVRALEDRWLSAIEQPEQRPDLIEALNTLNRNGRGSEAAALAWTWLATEKEKSTPAELLELGRDLIIASGDNDEMRKEILRLYEEVFSDRPEISRLIDASGLRGGKSPRRALRTLEICLGLKVGDYLIGRSDENVVQVTAIDPETCEYTVKTRRGEKTLDADALGLAYDPIDTNDFRVLIQSRPDEIRELLESDPVMLVIGMLQSHRGRLDSDQLEHLLVPAFIPADKFAAWWSKAKTALKRSQNVIVEGRNPVILTYDAKGQTLEDEVEPQWARAETPQQRLAVVETYLREAKARRTGVKPATVQRFHRDLVSRVNAARKGSPAHALAEALVIDRLAESGELSTESTASAILRESPDVVGLLRQIGDNTLYSRALELLQRVRPDAWPDLYLQLLPFAPTEACETIARALVKTGRQEQLAAVCREIPADFTSHLEAICWFWRGSSIEGLSPLPPRELLLRLLNHLSELTISDSTPPSVLRHARQTIRSAMSAGKYARYRQVIEGMEPGLASTVRRTVDRLDGLGQVVRSTMLKIIQETHPELYVKARVDPWLDENILFGTQTGMHKREEELNFLVNVKMKENAKAIGEAASHGDLSENSEYKFALEERDLLRARVAVIQNELSMARLLTANDVQTDTVTVGTRVALEDSQGHRREMTILGPWEADIEKGVYNYRAPLPGKLRGLQVGDTAMLDLDGTEREWRITSIVNALEG